MHFLYKITNIVNGKIYIGQSKNDKYRWRQHIYFAKNPEKTGQYIHRAMAKYGIENFKYEIIATCLTQTDANETENILIIQHNSRNKLYGYNLTVGGHYGGHSEETRQKLREATTRRLKENGHPCTGQKRTPEQIENLKRARKEHPVNYTPEIRQRMSDAHKGQKHPQEVVEKRKASLKITTDAKTSAKIESGEYKCNAPGCEVQGQNHYKICNGIRYCAKHAERFIRHGDVNKVLPPHKTIGQEPPNKVKFTSEQIEIIMSDPRSAAIVGKDFGVGEKVIWRIRKENSTTKSVNRMTKEEKMAAGIYKCSVPDCENNGPGPKYLCYDGVRYCLKHYNRLKRNGSLEVKPAFRWTKENPISAEAKEKLRLANIGREPPNKHKFTPEQISAMLDPTRSLLSLGKEFGVTAKVILRIRKENKS